MAKTRLDPLNQLSAGSLVRSLFNTLTAGSAVITKVLVGTGVLLTFTGADSGTGDVTVSTNGQPLTTGANFGDTSPAPADPGVFTGAGAYAYSTKTKTMVFWTGSVWAPMVSLPPGESAIAAVMTGGGGVVDFGDFSTSQPGVPNDLGLMTGPVYAVIDLGTF